MTDTQTQSSADGGRPAETRVRSCREALHGAIVDVSSALRSSDVGSWRDRVVASLERTHRVLEAHALEAESRDGLLGRLVDEEPAYGPRIEALKREHGGLIAHSEGVLGDVRASGDTADVRRRATDLIAAIDDHRHRAADLLFDVYGLDLAAVD